MSDAVVVIVIDVCCVVAVGGFVGGFVGGLRLVRRVRSEAEAEASRADLDDG
jgi:hypothetical protein